MFDSLKPSQMNVSKVLVTSTSHDHQSLKQWNEELVGPYHVSLHTWCDQKNNNVTKQAGASKVRPTAESFALRTSEGSKAAMLPDEILVLGTYYWRNSAR